MTSVRPTPSMAVAATALFVSLGGVSYGVATGSIDSREIKNNSIRGGDLRSSSITAREIKARSIDGTDIKLNRVGNNAVKEEVLDASKFGKVPSAANADTAGSASTYGGFTPRRIDSFALTVGGSRPVATIGPFTFTARCAAGAAAGEFDAVLEVVTSADNAALNADNTDADFDALDGARVVVEIQDSTQAFNHADDAYAIGADGTEVWAEVYAAVNTGGQTNGCRFGGLLLEG